GLGAGVSVEIDSHILDSGRPAQALLEDTESGAITVCFFSTRYLADRVPGLCIFDLPYVFPSLDDAHGALDGALGAALSERTRRTTGLLPLGYWDNGFRHLSNRSRDVHTPDDCRGLRIRLQPNWAHEALFRALGAEPVCNDLREGIAMLMSGELDAQENPFANFVAYGVHTIHPHVTLTGHVYGARGVYASAAQLADWPPHARDVLQAAVTAAVAQQRADAATTEAELRDRLAAEGTRIIELSGEEHAAFRAVAEPVLQRARTDVDDELWALLDT
ncbi:MAG TPA: TRAP transporter substrate-binding protein, partial [Euzebyales bacterium]|nr:TRAP transporter substrate-binding protein [Euzebyales bacterium]